MFGQPKQPPIKSLIAGGTVIAGDIAFADGLRVDGQIQGSLTGSKDTPSLLVVSESAIIVGDIHADHVIINGAVQGRVQADQLLELQPKAKIDGDVTYKALEMHQGAVISGQLRPLISKVEDAAILKLPADNA